ncbi:hypothetical protein V8G54_002678 [Vigna mungo]|uniref:Uncharacterized protein n=1 Tax=Vigna mungo TaxID=3915 RepID=A0AAQ3PAJ5_VIGMU
MSFWKQDPPKPTLAFKNFGPILESVPMEWDTCATSAPVASHSADMAFTEEILCARKALAASFESSADHKFVHRIFSSGTQFAYTSFRVCMAFCPSGVSLPPMRTLSGLNRSSIAVPSARNSGFERMVKLMPLLL